MPNSNSSNTQPEQQARELIDAQLGMAGWKVQSRDRLNLAAAVGVAVREVNVGGGAADYTLFVDQKVIGIVEAKKFGHSLSGVESQTRGYAESRFPGIPCWCKPIPFCYEANGEEIRYSSLLDPRPRSRDMFGFHRPETLRDYVQREKQLTQALREFPPLPTEKLWDTQIEAITNLEKSFAAGRRRALIQMATGSGKTFTAVNFVYRILKQTPPQTKVLFLVDRGNLGIQTHKEFQQFESPLNNLKFIEEFNIQRLTRNKIDDQSRVVIGTIQRLFSMLRGETAPAEDLDDLNLESSLFEQPAEVEYNPKIPIETFDFIVIDECHRSIYQKWRQVVEYFDATLIGLTATPSKETIGFFHKNLVHEYGHERAVADGVNVGCDVYLIDTEISQKGGKIKAGYVIGKRDRQTRKKRWETLDEDFRYAPNELDRAVTAVDQIRTVLQTFKDSCLPECFPHRKDVPKTLIFAKDDNHAEEIVNICREVFEKGNDFCQKITYRAKKPGELLNEFRNSYNPRIAVTVDMIATGTDIKPLEIVLFMRSVRSRNLFEQMKGRGVRIISKADMEQVNPGVTRKTKFLIVDAVGVCERVKTDSRPLNREPSKPMKKLLESLALGNRETKLLETLGARLIRLHNRIDEPLREKIRETSGGSNLQQLGRNMILAVDPDTAEQKLRESGKLKPNESPAKEILEIQRLELAEAAASPVAHNPDLRTLIETVQRQADMVIDEVTLDQVLFAGADPSRTTTATKTIESFRQYIRNHQAEIDALSILYSRRYKDRLTDEKLKQLEKRLREQSASWTEDFLWEAFTETQPEKVRGRTEAGRFADLVNLVKFALEQEEILEPFADSVRIRFNRWLASHNQFMPDQRRWLEMIRDHIATNLSIEPEDFEFVPFNQLGGLGAAYDLFGDGLNELLEELNRVLAM